MNRQRWVNVWIVADLWRHWQRSTVIHSLVCQTLLTSNKVSALLVLEQEDEDEDLHDEGKVHFSAHLSSRWNNMANGFLWAHTVSTAFALSKV